MSNKECYLEAIDKIEKNENVSFPKSFISLLTEQYFTDNYMGHHIYTHISPNCWHRGVSDIKKYRKELEKFDSLPFNDKVNIYKEKIQRPKFYKYKSCFIVPKKYKKIWESIKTPFSIWEFGYENQGCFHYYILYNSTDMYECGIDGENIYFIKPVINFVNETWSWDNINLFQFINEGNYPKLCPLWKTFFKQNSDMLDTISEGLKERYNEKTIFYPEINKVFRAFYDTPLKNIKVVLLGMDPYHNGSAVGLCFSVLPGNKINPSLKNIYKELENCGYTINKNGDLTHWAKQGCLMLNTALTVEKSSPDSHTRIWKEFTKKVITFVSENTENVIWLLMGNKALDFRDYICNNKNHKFFITSHPSPFSAHKGFREYPAFLGSGVFKKINENIKEKIHW